MLTSFLLSLALLSLATAVSALIMFSRSRSYPRAMRLVSCSNCSIDQIGTQIFQLA
ncbi:hypothetical protein BDN70DRAFT_885572 [Pholiota conissans]|uniref:NADH dehydrogenase subunit 4L n=1 Tax=Pholiota conissans TaxID=109636 RepID=A0A9P5YQT8_9AGAR|nr:hypothetical protein BDN70DRAFT_885572 [Pholiota conissans]